MALYLGGDKLQVNMNNIVYRMNCFSTMAILNGIQLLSSDSYILRDCNGLYLTVKEEV